MDPLHQNTQRVVLLIDLQPLVSSQNPNRNTTTSYFSPILASIRRILSAPQLATSLSALKFVFSNLSPISSSSKTHHLLGKCPNSLSFNEHHQTLIALSEALQLISSNPDLSNWQINGASKASLLAKLLLQLENEYAWEAKRSAELDQGLLRSGSNLVIVFSPVPQDADILAQFVDLEATVDGPLGFHDFGKKFVQIFGPVKERLSSRDISLSWVRVDFEIGSDKEITGSSWFEAVLKENNWGFSSTDAIVLGSSIIPVGLIFPFIGCSIGKKHGRNSEIAPLALVLEISDANGNPLECKCCQLEALHLQIMDQRSVNMSPSFQNFGCDITKFSVKGVKKVGDSERILKNASSMVLIHGLSNKFRESTQKGADEFLPDTILEHFCTEKGELVREMPIWQLFLSFLYSRNYAAMISLPDSNGTCLEGVLIPFTINHGLLYVLEKGFLETERCRCGLLETKGEKRKRKKVIEHLLESRDFLSFRDIALSHSEAGVLGDVCDLYFCKFSSKLKKLKFFKCWVNQMRESCTGSCNITAKERESEVKTENIQPQEVSLEDKMHNNEGVSPFSSVEEAEIFLGSIEEKIEKDLVLEDGNLGISVENFIHLIMDAVSTKVGGEGQGVGLEVASLILKKPKDLLAKYRESSYSTNYKLREHEIQILFRLEILKSVAGSHIEETRKQRMIREICLLLQFIDLNLQSSCVATSIIDFVERTIKSRYAHSIQDIVQQIYGQMEFDMSEQDETFYSPNNTDPDNTGEPKIEKLSIHEQIDEMMEKKKMKARERIDRQRRFKSFTSWTPDLHRVWALKQPKFDRNGLDLKPPSSSRRKKRRISGNFVVCETPMTGLKETTSGTKTPNRSLSKALFTDEFDSVQASPCTDTCG
ncbi:LIM domain protein [Rhynchospora pubera]|uniref:LIM domain protein n=1 Tax=Rhynchospora pubera TaxID=906938 RepID=A0AAV8FWA3_9POAL|nr:LIM domain protein [Rhynchospora pubera]